MEACFDPCGLFTSYEKCFQQTATKNRTHNATSLMGYCIPKLWFQHHATSAHNNFLFIGSPFFFPRHSYISWVERLELLRRESGSTHVPDRQREVSSCFCKPSHHGLHRILFMSETMFFFFSGIVHHFLMHSWYIFFLERAPSTRCDACCAKNFPTMWGSNCLQVDPESQLTDPYVASN